MSTVILEQSSADRPFATERPKPHTAADSLPIPTPQGWKFAGIWVDLLVAAFFTAVLIQWSFDHGRLLLYPGYDDIAYFRESLTMLSRLHQSVGALAAFCRYTPAHAPVTAMLGLLGFATLGVRDWVPYAMDGILVFAALRLFRAQLRHVPSIYRWALIATVLATPLVGELVVVFRPDLFYGLIFALGLVWVTTHPIVNAPRATLLKMGAWLGIVLLIKTSVYPQTCLLFAGAIFLRTIVDILGFEQRAGAASILRNWLIVLIVGVLIALPHYWFAFHTINDYIYETVFGSRKDFWAHPMSVREAMLYYLTGLGGQHMLGPHVYVIIGLFWGLSAAVLLGPKATRGVRLEWVAVLLVVVASYALPTLNKTKSAYLGVGFQCMCMVVVMYLANELFRREMRQRAAAGVGDEKPTWFSVIALRTVCIFAAAVSVILFSWPYEMGTRASAAVAQHNQTITDLYSALRKFSGEIPEPQVMITATGERVNPDQFMYQGMRLDNKVIHVEPNLFTHELPEQVAAMQRNDFIFASEPGTGETTDTIQSPEQQQRMLDALRQLPEFRLCASIDTLGGAHYLLFVRRSLLLSHLEPFMGFEAVSGLGVKEGPYRQYNLPAVRPGLLPASVCKFNCAEAGQLVLLMDVMTLVPNQTLTLKLNGMAVAEFKLETDWHFHPLLARLNAIAGSNRLEFAYTAGENNPEKPKAVIFETLRIVPAAQYDAR